jgi:WD40 repeat protein
VEGGSSIAVSPDGAILVSSGVRSALLGSWQLDGDSSVAPVIDGPGSYPSGYRADSRQLMVESGSSAAGFPVGERRLWDPAARSLDGALDVLVAAYADAGRIAALEPDGVAVILGTGGDRTEVEGFDDLEMRNYAIDPARRRLALGYDDGRVEQWDLDTGRSVGPPTIAEAEAEVVGGEGVDSLSYLQGGRVLAVARRGTTSFYDADTGEEVLGPVAGQSVAAPPDGAIFVTTTSGGLITVHDGATAEPVAPSFQGARSRTNHMNISDDHRLLLVSSWDGTLRLFDLRSQTQLGLALPVPFAEPLTPHLGGVLAPDGSQMAAATPLGVQLWDLDPEAWEEDACTLAGRNLSREEWARYLPSEEEYVALCPQWPVPN